MTDGFLDGGVFLGRDARTGIGFDDAEGLHARLDRFAVGQALAHDFLGILYDFRLGNDRTLAVCERSGGRLVPVATINLNGWHPADYPLGALTAAGFKAVALHARWQFWDWDMLTVERLSHEANTAGIALQPAITAPREFAAAARALAPSGATIAFRMLGRGGYTLLPEIVEAAERWPNTLFDVSTITQTGGIAWLADKIGAERLYVASGAPIALEGASLFPVWAAELTADQRDMIAGGSLRKALGLGGNTSNVEPPECFLRLNAAEKIDTHSHTGTWNIVEPAISEGAIRRELDRNNLQAQIVNSIQSLNGDLEAGNASLADFIATDPRLYGLIVVDPMRCDASRDEIARHMRNPKFVGLKSIQDFYERDLKPLALDDPAYGPFFEIGTAEKLPFMAHIPGMANAARKHPDQTFICAHSTWRYGEFDGLENVYFDIATSTNLRSECDLRGLIDAVGAGKVIFSCDTQLMTTVFTLGKLASIDITDAELGRILRRNALDAFPRLKATAA